MSMHWAGVVASIWLIRQPHLSTARMLPMTESDFHLVADVSSDDLAAIEPVLRQIVNQGITETPGGFHVDTTMTAPARGISTGRYCRRCAESSGGPGSGLSGLAAVSANATSTTP
jgi:hypothetical protein